MTQENGSDFWDIDLVAVNQVLETEEYSKELALSLARSIKRAKFWSHPVFIEKSSMAVMDGHHRVNAARILGLQFIPAIMLGYDDPRVHLASWRPDITVTPEEIIARALSGRVYPLKTTRHTIQPHPPTLMVPLHELMRPDRHWVVHQVAPALGEGPKTPTPQPHLWVPGTLGDGPNPSEPKARARKRPTR